MKVLMRCGVPARFVLLALGILSGCRPESAEMEDDEIREFAAAYTEAWSSHDASRVASYFSKSGSLKVNNAEPAVGREAIAAVAQGFVDGFPDFVLTMNSLQVSAETVEYHWTFSGTNTGPGGGGQAVRFSGYEEWSIGDDGLVSESRGHFDEVEYARQLEFGIGG
jgi:uncharacterized protein (TIGR02246 family)